MSTEHKPLTAAELDEMAQRAEAEVTRLRAALAFIEIGSAEDQPQSHWYQKLARAALGKEP